MKTSITLSIPTEWSEVSTKKYCDYIKSTSDDDTSEENIEKILQHFCNLKPNVVKYLKVKDLERIHNSLAILMKKPLNNDIIHKIDIGGVKYGFHPNLDELTMGEFVDLDTHSKNKNLSKMMGVLYRPIVKEEGNNYSIEPYSFDVHGQNYKLLEKLSVNIVNPIAVFFWNLGNNLLVGSLASLEAKEQKE